MNHGRRIERAAALALALAALLTAALTTSAAMAASQGLAGRIAFTPSDSSIKTVEGDGTRGAEAYTRGGDWGALKLSDPAYSPDGRKVAFAGDGTRIGVIDARAQQGDPKTVAQAGDTLHTLGRPAFSADGKTIAFQAAEGLFTVPAAGGTPAKLALPATYKNPADPAYSPDGRLLAFTALDADGDRRVYLKNFDNDAISQLTVGSGHQDRPAFSPDGATVVYVDTPLAPGGGFGLPQLAVRPVSGGAPDILWSNQVEPGRFVTGRPAYAPDGTRVAFTVAKPNDPACAGELTVVNTEGAANPRAIGCSTSSVDWAVRTAEGANKLLSALPGSTRETADQGSGPASMSAEGRYAVFTSDATNLVAGVDDANGKTDVFVRDLAAGKTALVSANKDNRIATGVSDSPVIDAKGATIAFRSTASDVVDRITIRGTSAVYARSVDGKYTTLVSRQAGTINTTPHGDSRPVAISADGRRVLYSATGTDVVLDQGESENDPDLFVFNLDGGATTLVTAKAGSASAASNGTPGKALFSADGKTVVFESTATDLVAGFVDHNGAAPNLYKRDLTTNTTTLLDGAKGSVTDGSAGTPDLMGVSRDGQTVVYTSDAPDVLADHAGVAHDLYARTGATTTLAGAGADTAALSADGTHVFFSAADGQVWMRAGGTLTLVTRGVAPEQGADGPSRVIDATDTGDQILVSSTATDLTPALKHHGDEPTLYRIATGTFEAEPLSARADDTADKAPAARTGAMSADGTVVAYTSNASNLVDGLIDGNGDGTDVYAWMERRAAERDPIKPTVKITTPADQQVYREGAVVQADYSCDDEGPSGLTSCDGTVPVGQPIDTSGTGSFTFTVTAKDGAGNTGSESVTYRVA
ncbi:MAG TPA: hypothetical protein VI300_11350, partial [Solirubrobacter sp.]